MSADYASTEQRTTTTNKEKTQEPRIDIEELERKTKNNEPRTKNQYQRNQVEKNRESRTRKEDNEEEPITNNKEQTPGTMSQRRKSKQKQEPRSNNQEQRTPKEP